MKNLSTHFIKRMVLLFAFATMLIPSGFSGAVKAASPAELDKSGTKLTLNQSASGKLTSCDEENWFVFDITQSGYFTITLQPSANADLDDIKRGWTLSIYDKDLMGEPIKTFYDLDSQFTTFPLGFHKGRYYLKIITSDRWSPSNSPINVPYSLKVNFSANSFWETEYNDISSKANVIYPNKTYYGVTYYSKDDDWFKVTTTNSGYYQLYLESDSSNDFNNLGDGWGVQIFDNYMTEIANYSNGSSKLKSCILPWEKGTFFIRVYSANRFSESKTPTGCTYKLQFKQVASDYWERENNDSSSSANTIKLNKSYSGITHDLYDYDWFKFTVKTKSAIKINFNSDSENNIEDIKSGWKITLYNKNKVTVLEEKSSILSSGSVKTIVEKGTYYLKVESSSKPFYNNSPTECKYNLKAICTSAPTQKTSIKKITPGKRKATITWNKTSGASGYILYRSTKANGKYTKIATIKKGSTTKYVDKKRLKRNTTYYYKICAYKTANGLTVQGAKSTHKKARIR